MILALLAAAAAVCTPVAQTPKGSLSDGWPPARFRGDVTATIRFVPPERVGEVCGAKPTCGYVTLGCTLTRPDGSKLVVLPNPNAEGPAADAYRKLVAHELGHVNGWAGDHPR